MPVPQDIVFKETILAMKKATKRKAYESDSDSEIEHPSNRGQKLKKRARFVRQGQMAPPTGPEAYREIVNYAGYRRAIISRNPPLVDDDGYELDSDDDEDHIQEVAEAVNEFNPYASIQIESVLAPLTSVTELPTHPTLSRPYTTKTLSDLAKQGCDIMHKENAALWKVKHLQTKLNGDHIWVPCEVMIGPNDMDLYRDDPELLIHEPPKLLGPPDIAVPLLEDGAIIHVNGQSTENGETSSRKKTEETSPQEGAAETADTSMTDVDTIKDSIAQDKPKPSGEGSEEAKLAEKPKEDPETSNNDSNHDANTLGKELAAVASVLAGQNGVNGVSTAATMTPIAGEELAPIHPFFLAPRSAHPDRDLGIPDAEADDVRRLLQLYVQKQEEVCRGAKRLYEGLLRADRLRKTVLQWSKQEAHSGPNRDMSDGEDWYDKEEWGLEDDLKKGQDEEEEDTSQPAKKTRTRR